MKNLFIYVVMAGIFSTTTNTTDAQTNINIEKLNQKSAKKISLKFIDGIEFAPEVSPASAEVNTEKTIAPVKKDKAPEKQITASSSSAIETCEAWQFKYAMMLDMEVESFTNSALYSFIDQWWGTRYSYGGSTRAGIDCSAFTGKLLKEVFNITVPRTAREQYQVSNRIVFRDHLREGDLVFFNTRGGVSHVGLYLGNNYFVHSSVHDGVTISSLTDPYYDKKFISGGRIYPQQGDDTLTNFTEEDN
ncbi:C40 family peptidase [Ferruginibacter lapsinanis]|uniref:C40 family peptidase n=1 Tax=Ferruginibacter lapsinanis TaxID=563172 RepID=UPI001E4FEF26|nr:C40 family peptidase [Ferruginibacter lapsinanis]UEG49355.1 C40 family peptidase [Ferruginibacter lapsinanis]